MTSEDQAMQSLAQLLDNILNPADSPVDPDRERHGFALLVFTPGAIGGSHANWVSNCDRQDMIAAMKEMLDRFDAQAKMARTVQ